MVEGLKNAPEFIEKPENQTVAVDWYRPSWTGTFHLLGQLGRGGERDKTKLHDDPRKQERRGAGAQECDQDGPGFICLCL